MLWESKKSVEMDTSDAPVIKVDPGSLKSIAGKTIIVTGASSGIGLETAEFFYNLGCNVVFVGGRKRPDTYVDLNSPRALACQCDISSWDSQVEVFEAAKRRFGQIDIVCLNAGVAEPRGQFFDVQIDEASGKPLPLDLRVFDVDLKGTAYGVGLSFHYLKEKGGSVIMVTSRAGYGGNEMMPGYSASKNGKCLF
jgi:NAD(P)-dependent dehydrogenase (short-subunit alcohol dehydrogenase family)